METVQPGKYVEMAYDLYQVGPDGTETLVHQSDPSDPERIIFGVTPGVIEPLEKALEGLAPGQPFEVTADAAEAFGEHDPEQVATLERDIFIVDGKFDEKTIHPGASLPMMTADGMRIYGLVTDVTPTHVVMDFNHPLAGKTVRFKGIVKTVRDATPEELHPSCGCGGGSCGGGSCGDDSGCCGNCSCN